VGRIGLAAIVTCALVVAAHAVPPHPRLWEYSEASRRLYAQNAPDPVRVAPQIQPDGIEYVLVLRVDFADQRGERTRAELDRLLFAEGTPSLASYYAEASYGAMDIQPGPSGGSLPRGDSWYRMPDDMPVYGSGRVENITGMRALVRDACNAANADVNFADYDRDGDGVVDHLIILHAGNDEASSGVPDDIWSVLVPDVGRLWDGVRVGAAMLIGEEPSSETPHIGVWFHEFFHDFGAPEAYATGVYVGASDTKFGLMGLYGPYQGGADRNGTAPAHISGYLKWDFDGVPENGRHGWITPVEIDTNTIGFTVPAFSMPGGLPPVYKIDLPGTGGKEFFLIENRERDVGAMFDTAIPDEGLLIWHVDESIPRPASTVAARLWLENPADPFHRYVQDDITEDAAYAAEDRQTAFTPSTEPNSSTTDGGPTGISILGISDSGDPMTFDIFFGDTYEPNDTLATAFPLRVGEKYDSFIFDAADTIDLYALRFDSGDRTRITARYAEDAAVAVVLTTRAGREVTRGTSRRIDDGRETVLLYEARSSEELILRVTAGGGVFPVAYSIEVAAEPEAPVTPPLFVGLNVYPNPVRPGADLRVSVAFDGPGLDSVRMETFTASGDRVAQADTQDIATGDVTIALAADNAGRPLAPGVYFVLITATRAGQIAKRLAKFAVE
jgi:M6 family metalloprotease-like protein